MFRACFASALLLCLAPLAFAQATGSQPSSDLAALDFLIGTWSAKTTGSGSAKAAVTGFYSFRRDLGGHAVQRTGSLDTCSGPQTFDCQHHDQLTIFPDPNSPHGSGLYALYLDNEGHVIYYTVATPDAHTAVFNSQGPGGAPHFRLIYHLEGDGPGAVMTGKFQASTPGSSDFHSYLEWSGARQ